MEQAVPTKTMSPMRGVNKTSARIEFISGLTSSLKKGNENGNPTCERGCV